jgi:DNA repair photolyase
MILSASRRTDIPAYYCEWFFNRLREGFVLVRNPMNVHQVSEITLMPDTVDCIVFWSKNPRPMLDKLHLLDDYPFYFQFTLNSYTTDIETGLPRKSEIIETFKALSDKIGAHRVIWRYDPILLNQTYTIAYHAENFGKIARALKGYTEKVTISFIDFYAKIAKNIKALHITQMNDDDKRHIAKDLSGIARENGFSMDTCAEDIDLSEFSIDHARCIDDRLIKRIINCNLKIEKDKTQRLTCGCVAAVDIGAYNSCPNGCLYCYANYNAITKNRTNHNPLSPLLIGKLLPSDLCKKRNLSSHKQRPERN